MSILNFLITVDTDTGEFTVKDVDSNNSQKLNFKEVDCVAEEPIIRLLKNKLSMNKAAANLIDVNPNDRVSIVFDKNGRATIGKSELINTTKGNIVTNKLTVSCSGFVNEELSKKGDCFTLVKNGSGLCSLFGNKEEQTVVLDENIQKPDEEGIVDIPNIDVDDILNNLDLSTPDFNLDEASNFQVHGLDFSF